MQKLSPLSRPASAAEAAVVGRWLLGGCGSTRRLEEEVVHVGEREAVELELGEPYLLFVVT